MKKTNKKPGPRAYRVWFPQINQQTLDVLADNPGHAKMKARNKMCRGGYPEASDIREITKGEMRQ